MHCNALQMQIFLYKWQKLMISESDCKMLIFQQNINLLLVQQAVKNQVTCRFTSQISYVILYIGK